MKVLGTAKDSRNVLAELTDAEYRALHRLAAAWDGAYGDWADPDIVRDLELLPALETVLWYACSLEAASRLVSAADGLREEIKKREEAKR